MYNCNKLESIFREITNKNKKLNSRQQNLIVNLEEFNKSTPWVISILT